MTIAATITSQQYLRNGTTTQWSFNNKIFSAADLIVNDLDTSVPPIVTPLVLGVDYTVQNVDVDAGCMVTTTVAGVNGHTLDVRTNIAELQTTSIKNQGSFLPELHEEAFDKLTREIQDLRRLTYAFGIHGPDVESAPWPALPTPASRKNTYVAFDVNGTLMAASSPPLAGGTSANLINYTPPGTGAVPRSVQSKFQDMPSVFDWLSAAQQANVALNIGSIDVTAAYNAAITANPKGNLYMPPGTYLISGAGLSNVVGCSITGVRYRSTFLLGTQNMNGITFGDGTVGTRNAASACRLDSVAFNPMNGVATFASGSCVVRNNVFDVHVNNCDFFGKDSTTVRLWNAITDISTTDCDSNFCNTALIQNNVVNVSGTSSGARASDCFYNFHRFNNIGGDALFVGVFVGGLTFTNPTGFFVNGWSFRMNSSPGTDGQNIFISNPDFECDGTGQGIWIQQGNGVGIGGEGWMGGSATCKLIWFGVNASNCKALGLNLFGGQVVMDGPNCYYQGGNQTGDGVTSTTGVLASSTATNSEVDGVKINQYITSAVAFVSGPPVGFKVRAHFNNVAAGGPEITGLATSGLQPPDCRGCTTDASTSVASASALPLNFGRDFITITGTTAINSMTIRSQGDRIICEPTNAAGITFNNGSGIITKSGAPQAVPQFKIIEFVCDGNATWFEIARNF